MPIDDSVRNALAELKSVLPELRATPGMSVNIYRVLHRCVSAAGTDEEKSLLETYHGLRDINAITNLVEGLLGRYKP